MNQETTDGAESQLIIRERFETAALVAAHPPLFTHPHKRFVYGLASASSPPAGEITYSRWRTPPALPAVVPGKVPSFEMREDVFGYEPLHSQSGLPVFEWYLNFADPHLFGYYGGALLAQDELQVLEHPALGSLREAVRNSPDARLRPSTWEREGATPVLVRGGERRCALALNPDRAAGRPGGLYGNHFSHATPEAVRRALTVLEPPTISNILAVAALPGGSGRYRESEIQTTLMTACAGFLAAKTESHFCTPGSRVVIHTGNWGTGAFGGNRVLMALLQLLAARLTGLDRLVFHTVDAAGSRAYEEAAAALEELVPAGSGSKVEEVLWSVAARGYQWGQSNGT